MLHISNDTPEDSYDWGTRDNIETVHRDGVFAGPIALKDALPFKITGLNAAYKAYSAHIRKYGLPLNFAFK